MTSLPASICSILTLRTLDISHNMLTHLPDQLDQLIHLEYLVAIANRLMSLPPSCSGPAPVPDPATALPAPRCCCLTRPARQTGGLRGATLHGAAANGRAALRPCRSWGCRTSCCCRRAARAGGRRRLAPPPTLQAAVRQQLCAACCCPGLLGHGCCSSCSASSAMKPWVMTR